MFGNWPTPIVSTNPRRIIIYDLCFLLQATIPVVCFRSLTGPSARTFRISCPENLIAFAPNAVIFPPVLLPAGEGIAKLRELLTTGYHSHLNAGRMPRKVTFSSFRLQDE